MGERTSYTPGTFSWTDLTTTDQESAKAFYTALFGWEAIDNPVGDGVYYTMMRLGGVSGSPVRSSETRSLAFLRLSRCSR